MVKDSIRVLAALAALFAAEHAHAAITIPLTVTLSEAVTVTGSPQIAVDVGGTARYAVYSGGTGTNTLTFTLSPQAGDVDLDGIAVASPILLNGGTIKDSAGNDLSPLTFTPPNTAGIKINYPSLSMDFIYDADGRYTLNGTAYNDLTSFLTASGGTFTRASVGTYYDSAGILQTASSGTPRFDWDPVTHTAKGILIEESRTNLTKYSNDVSDAAWFKARMLATANAALAPDNTMTATHLSDNGVSGGAYTRQAISYTANTTYTISIYAKKAELDRVRLDWYASTGWSSDGMVVFNLTTGTTSTSGTVNNYSMTPVGNGWYRCSATATFGAVSQSSNYPAVTMHINLLDSTSGFYVWGGQIEQGAFPTSLIPTTSAAATRSADNFVFPIGGWFNNSSGTLFGEGNAYNAVAATYAGSSPTLASINTSTASNIARLGRYTSSPSTGLFQSSVASVTFTNLGLWANNSIQKIAGSYSTTGYSSILGANTINTSGAAPLTGTMTELRVGQYALSGYWSSTVSAIKYYPSRVTDTQLQLLTQ